MPSRGMLVSAVLLCASSCAEEKVHDAGGTTGSGSRDEDGLIETRTTIVLAGGDRLHGSGRIKLQLLEGAEGEAVTSLCQIEFEASSGDVTYGVYAEVPDQDVLRTDWEAQIGPAGRDGASTSASVTLMRGEEERLAERGTISFERSGDRIVGEVAGVPEALSSTFSGEPLVLCSTRSPDNSELLLDDPQFDSDFCRQFVDLLPTP